VAVAGLVGLGAWVGTSNFSTVEIPLTMTRGEAETEARSALQERGVDPDAWTMVSAVTVPRSDDDRFVWQEGGPGAYQQLMGPYLDGPFWQVRFVTFADSVSVEERAEEYRVNVSPEAGLTEVVHELPEAAPGDSLPEPAARAIADSVVQARYGHDPAALKRVGAEPTARPNRRDWTFTYADTTGYPLDQGEARIQVDLAGSEITNASSGVHVPESWQRETRRRETPMQIVELISVLLGVLIVLGGAVGALVYWARGHFRVWTFLLSAGGLFALFLAGVVNSWPETVAGFDTAQPYLNQVLLSLIGPVVLGAFAGGSLGLVAGFAHDRIGRNEPTPLLRSVVTGLGLGLLGSGLVSAAGMVGPSLSPPWASYGALDAALPWLAPVQGRLLTFVGLTLVLLLVAVVLHRWTRAGEQNVLASLGASVALGFVAAGVGPAEALGTWALQGVLLGLFLAGTLLLVWRHDRSVVPMMAAGFVLLRGAEAVGTAAQSSVLVGELVALGLTLVLALGWTAVLRRRQAAEPVATAD
jgi:hypothetical protein